MINIDQCLSANRPLIFATCESDLEMLQYLREKHDHKKDGDKKPTFYVYSTTIAQVVKLSDLIDKHFSSTEGKRITTIEALDYILNRPFHTNNNFFETYIFLDCDAYINDRQIQRKVKDILSRYQLNPDFTINLLMMSQTVCVPLALERLSEVVFFDLPNEGELQTKSEELTKKLNLKPKDFPSEEVKANLRGLTLFEVEQAYLQSIKLHKEGVLPTKIDLDFIRNFKKAAIAKTDLLSLMEANTNFEDIGGMLTLKNWIMKSAGGWTVEGKKFGLPNLKGLLLIGLPGCGKSLICKAIGNQWKLPIICLDPSRVFSSRVGESEQNIRRVLTIVENISPCLVGETRVTLADGQVASIQELYENQYRGKVLSIGKNFETDISNVSLITKKRSDDVFNIRTQIGNIKATGNHKFPILKSNGELHWIEAHSLSKGDYVVCPRQVKTSKSFNLMNYVDDDTRFYSEKFNEEILKILKEKDPNYYAKMGRRIRGAHKNNNLKINTGTGYGQGRHGFVFKKELMKYGLDLSDLSHVKKISRGGGGYQDSSLLKFPVSVNEEFFYVLGLLWSDGNIGDRGYWNYDPAIKPAQKTDKYRQSNMNTSKFYGNEIILHKKITNYLEQNFGINQKTIRNKTSKLWITYGLPLILGEIFRKVQKDILILDEKYQWAWLSGVLDGDGHLHKQRVNYAATKHLNNEYIRDVFLRVGLPASSHKDDFKNLVIELTSNKFIKKAYQNMRLAYPKKIKGLYTLSEGIKETKCRMDTLDVREYLISILVKKDLIASTDTNTHNGLYRHQSSFIGLSSEINHIIHEYLERKRNIDRDKIKKVFNALGENPWFLQDNYYFSPISEISKIHGEFEVYDLCLDKNHNFIANRMFTHNCVLFIDEIEKGFAGYQSSTFSDSGVTARIIGTFLTWLQDCSKPVFTVATSNNIAYLPPELIQRFDEKFFVNLPQVAEREEIFKIHLKKLQREPKNFDIKKLAEESQDLSGREIEQVLKEGMYDAFSKKSENPESDLSTDIILNVLKKKTNLLLTMNEQLKFLLKWVGYDKDKKDGIRARFAHPIEENDITRIRSQIDSLISEVEKGPQTGGPALGGGNYPPSDVPGGCF